MKKLLVTGGMGHVGYETVKQAADSGIEVVAQYLSTFRDSDAERTGDRVSWVKCDLTRPDEVKKLAADHEIGGCIHTAAIPNDTVALPQPVRTFQTNVAATTNLLEIARRQNWRRFLTVSTGSVFQSLQDTVSPVPETAYPTPHSLYACTKRSAELMTTAYASSYGLSAASVRISWIFGPPLVSKSFDGPRGPIPEFLRRALRGEEIRDPSGGDFAASFTFVADCAAGLLAVYTAPGLQHFTYHLGSGQNQSTFEVARAVEKAVPGAVIEIGGGTDPWTQHTVMRGPLACERMKQEFDFSPRHSLEQAIALFADWMRANPESYCPASD